MGRRRDGVSELPSRRTAARRIAASDRTPTWIGMGESGTGRTRASFEVKELAREVDGPSAEQRAEQGQTLVHASSSRARVDAAELDLPAVVARRRPRTP